MIWGGVNFIVPDKSDSDATVSPEIIIAGLGVFIAFVSTIIAIMVYRRARKSEDLAHINAMFREMLAMEFQLYCTQFDSNEGVEKALSRFDRYKLWVLEELWLWVDRRKKLRWWSYDRRRIETENNEWADVISVHLMRCSTQTKARNWGDEAGYSARFQCFVKRIYGPKPEDAGPDFWSEAVARRHDWSQDKVKSERPLPARRSAAPSSADRTLAKLAELSSTGVLTETEFNAAKRRFLDRTQ